MRTPFFVNLTYRPTLIVLLSSELEKFNNIFRNAKDQGCKVIMVWDGTTRFPSTSISQLDKDLQMYFNQVVIPFYPLYANSCWRRIQDKIYDNIQVEDV